MSELIVVSNTGPPMIFFTLNLLDLLYELYLKIIIPPFDRLRARVAAMYLLVSLRGMYCIDRNQIRQVMIVLSLFKKGILLCKITSNVLLVLFFACDTPSVSS